MIQQRYSLTANASLRIESLLAQFERDRDRGPVESLADYAPSTDDPAYAAVVTELSRVDLEHRFEEQGEGHASAYIDAFPDVFADDHYLAQIAYEEYRLRCRFGENIDAVKVAAKYGADGNRWTKLPLGDSPEDDCLRQARSRRYTSRQPRDKKPVHYPKVGEAFVGYQLVAQLGEGAFSRVFLARQADLAKRFVVLKVTPLATEESEKLAKLQHSNIIPIYSVHRQDELSCICMPFLGATTLADVSACSERWASLDGPAQELVSTVLARQQSTIELIAGARDEKPNGDSTPIGVSSASPRESNAQVDETRVGLTELSSLGYVDALIELAIGAVEGVAHAHRRGIIHRDLKPANVLVTDEGCPVLLDFNLAVVTEQTDARVVGGTLPYMSPEQLESLRSGTAPQTSDDVFAMGVILYELLSGRLPFSSPDNSDSFDLDGVIADRRREPQSLRKLNSRVSPGLASIVERCVAPEPVNRYADGAELLEDLRRHRMNLPLRHAKDRSVAERLIKWTRRHPQLASASSVSVVAAGLLLTLASLWWQARISNERLAAETKLQQFQVELPSAIMALSTPGMEHEILADGIEQSSRWLNQWDVASDSWRETSGADRLEPERRSQLTRQLAHLLFLDAAAEIDLANVSGSDSNDRERRFAIAATKSRKAGLLDPSLQALVTYQQERMSTKPGPTTTRVPLRDIFPSKLLPDDLRMIAAGKLGTPSESRRLVSAQLDRQPASAVLWYQLAVANSHLGDQPGALSSFDICDRLQPDTIVTKFNRGLCHLSLGNHRQALADFAACLRLRPKLAIARFNHAVAAHHLGDHRAALIDLNHLVEAGDPTTRMVLFRAKVHVALGDPEAAERDRVTARAIQPRDVNDFVSRGISRLNDSPEAALADFESARRIDRNNVRVLENLAHVYAEKLSQPERAIEPLDSLIAIRPHSASAIASRGILHARLGRLETAIADAESASTLSTGGREKLQIAGIFSLVSQGLPLEGIKGDWMPSRCRKQAYKWLSRAIQSDAAMVGLAASDQDLAGLHAEPQFRRLMAGAMMIEKTAQ